MEINKANSIIFDSLNKAIIKGCYDLNEAKMIIIALETILSQPKIEVGEIEEKK